jgi:iron complex transport system permease protein
LSNRLRPTTFLTVAGVATLLLAATQLLRGSGAGLEVGEAWRALGAGLGLFEGVPDSHRAIVFDVRLPRVLVAVFAGASLAIAGTVMQAVFRNPLASPEIMGTTAGSALGAVIAIAVGLAGTTALAVPAFAFAGSGAVSFIVYAAAAAGGGATVLGILLAGMAMNLLAGAATTFVVSLSFGHWDKSNEILHWLMGGLDNSTLRSAWIVLIGLVVFAGALVPFLRDMDLLTLRDESAQALGIRVTTLRKGLLFVACGVTATAVSSTGGIAFVGLVVPHMVRLLVGPVHRGLLPCAAVGGGLILLLADVLCQSVPSSDLRAGVVTTVLGAPFFLYLLGRHRRGLAL